MNTQAIIQKYQAKWDNEVQKRRMLWIYRLEKNVLHALENLKILDVNKLESGLYEMHLVNDAGKITMSLMYNGVQYMLISRQLGSLVYGDCRADYFSETPYSSLSIEHQKEIDLFLQEVYKIPQEMFEELETYK